MNLSKFSSVRILNILLWNTCMFLFMIVFVNVFANENLLKRINNAIGVTFYLYLAFFGFFYFILNLITHSVHNALIIPYIPNTKEKVTKIAFVWSNLTLFMILSRYSFTGLILIYLSLNIIAINKYILTIKNMIEEKSFTFCVTFFPQTKTIPILIIVGTIFLMIQSFFGVLLIFPFFFGCSFFIWEEMGRYYRKVKVHISRHLLPAIMGITFILQIILYSITKTIENILATNSISPWFILLPIIFIGLLIGTLLNLKFYCMRQKIVFIQNRLAILNNSSVKVESSDISSDSSYDQYYSEYYCNICKRSIDNGINQEEDVRVPVFCPNCGNKLNKIQKKGQMEIQNSNDRPNSVLLEHDKLLNKLNSRKIGKGG